MLLWPVPDQDLATMSEEAHPDYRLYARILLRSSKWMLCSLAKYHGLKLFCRLANDDVTETMAQSASCITPKIFKTTLSIVRAALAQASTFNLAPDTPRRLRSGRNTVTYDVLLANHKVLLADVVSGWLDDAERLLDATAEFRADHDVNTPLVKCTVFFWVCQILGVSLSCTVDCLEMLTEKHTAYPD
jgi:hypothetical protein